MFMQNFGMTNKEYYGMSWYFLEWSIVYFITQQQTLQFVHYLTLVILKNN